MRITLLPTSTLIIEKQLLSLLCEFRKKKRWKIAMKKLKQKKYYNPIYFSIIL